jgi:hypothetical protein
MSGSSKEYGGYFGLDWPWYGDLHGLGIFVPTDWWQTCERPSDMAGEQASIRNALSVPIDQRIKAADAQGLIGEIRESANDVARS